MKNMARWNMAKWQVDKLAGWRNVKLTNWQIDQMTSWQDVWLTKRHNAKYGKLKYGKMAS